MQDLRERALEAHQEHRQAQEEAREKQHWKKWERDRDRMAQEIVDSELPDELVDRIEMNPDAGMPWVRMDDWDLVLREDRTSSIGRADLYAEDDCPGCDFRRHFGPIHSLADLGRFFEGERGHHQCYVRDKDGEYVRKDVAEREPPPRLVNLDELAVARVQAAHALQEDGRFETAHLYLLESIAWAVLSYGSARMKATSLEGIPLPEEL